MHKTIVVIGGGATGTAVALLAAQAGHKVVLVERGAMASGTTGHFHGMLHSGARYAVNDPAVAAACYDENQRLRTLVPDVTRHTGGLFVATSDDEAAHADVLLAACKQAGVPAHEVSVQQARKSEPALSTRAKRIIAVPDGTIDGAALVRHNRRQAEQASTPARFMTNTLVTGFRREHGHVSHVEVQHIHSKAKQAIACDMVVNATGVWAGQLAGLLGDSFEMVFDKGTMVVLKRAFTHAVINRCRPESDGDLLVPVHGASIMGTTARSVASPNHPVPSKAEIALLITEGATLVPDIAHAAIVRSYAGVRPLIRPQDRPAPQSSSRSISRGYQIMTHDSIDASNVLTITGGKVTLYYRMALDIMQRVEQRFS